MTKKFEPIPFDVKNPYVRSTREEWKPHARMSEKSFEWWYFTVLAYDICGNPYFIFSNITHWIGEGYQKMIGLQVADDERAGSILGYVSDYKNNKVYHPQYNGIMKKEDLWRDEDNTAICTTEEGHFEWSYGEEKMILKLESPQVSYNLEVTNIDEVLWHTDKHDVQGMIQQGAEDDFSFYYSLPRTPVTGTMTLTDDQGVSRDLTLSGIGWVDRQWGDFSTLTWEWSSFRFDNGARLHIYNFFNGHKEVVYMNPEGKITQIEDVIVRQNGYAKSPTVETWVSWGWTYEFPIEIEGSKSFTVIPYSNEDFFEFPEFNYALYEGGCKLMNNTTGQQVGVTVNESADVRIMENGPNGKNHL